MTDRTSPCLAGARVLVLGLGASGLAIARWCARCSAQVVAWDSRLETAAGAALARAAAEQVPGATLRPGPLDAATLDGIDRVFKSPGLAPHDASIAPLMAAAAARGVAIEGELDLFAQALAALEASRGYAPRVLAVTGTNGKTTTTAMTALLVERAGRRVAVAGNIGPTMLGTLAEALDAADGADGADAGRALPQVWVLELSSFQLHGVRGFEPDAAALLNLTQDHLDWHGSMDAYAADKARIFGVRTVRVVSRDDPVVEASAVPAPAKPARGTPRPAKAAPPVVVRFGLDAPRRAGDFGLVSDNGVAWLVRALEADAVPRRRRPAADANVESTAVVAPLQVQRLIPADALRVRGRHNAANALAALALATAIDCPLAPLLHALRDYRGEPHRVEHIATIDGIDAVDDSKGTNVGATVAALDGLGADRAPGRLVAIFGGDGKGQDFAPLAAPVARHVRAAALIGRDAAAIEAALAATAVPLSRHAGLEDATRWAFDQARPGDAVLLSPACASLDMFRDYAHRAQVFAAEVRAVAAERGVLA